MQDSTSASFLYVLSFFFFLFFKFVSNLLVILVPSVTGIRTRTAVSAAATAQRSPARATGL